MAAPTKLHHPWILQARVLEWGAIAFSDRTYTSGQLQESEWERQSYCPCWLVALLIISSAFSSFQLATHPVLGVQGWAHVTAQPAGLPTCCWMGSASPNAQMGTSTRKAVVQVSMAGAYAHHTLCPYVVFIMQPDSAFRNRVIPGV